jgi:hypothetical protein
MISSRPGLLDAAAPALDGAIYVQESALERVDVKRAA